MDAVQEPSFLDVSKQDAPMPFTAALAPWASKRGGGLRRSRYAERLEVNVKADAPIVSETGLALRGEAGLNEDAELQALKLPAFVSEDDDDSLWPISPYNTNELPPVFPPELRAALAHTVVNQQQPMQQLEQANTQMPLPMFLPPMIESPWHPMRVSAMQPVVHSMPVQFPHQSVLRWQPFPMSPNNATMQWQQGPFSEFPTPACCSQMQQQQPPQQQPVLRTSVSFDGHVMASPLSCGSVEKSLPTVSTAAMSSRSSWADIEDGEVFSEDSQAAACRLGDSVDSSRTSPTAVTSPGEVAVVHVQDFTSPVSQRKEDVVCPHRVVDCAAGSEDRATTVMVRNVACRYNQEDIEGILTELGLAGTYDSLYLPLNPRRRANLGYFFLNFLSSEHVDRCVSLLQGKPLGASNTEKLCEVSVAHVQGKMGLVKHRKMASRAVISKGKGF